MTYSVVLDERAINQAARFSPDVRRLRVGPYRVLYEIRDDVIAVRYLARRPPPS